MPMEMWITLFILLAAIVLFATEKLRVDIVALCVLIALTITGVLTTEEAFTGFSSTSVLSIGFLFVVGGAVFQTGVTNMIVDHILKIAGTSETRLLVVLLVTIAGLSAVISSTGVVALMLPAVINLANRTQITPSRLLIPLAFSALLGGTTTLIATPPNIIASEALQSAGLTSFDFFSFTPLGILLVIVGIIYLLTVGKRLLPNRKTEHVIQRMETPAELFELYKLPDNMFRLRVHNVSPLIGHTIGSSGLRNDFHINVVGITRSPNGAREVPTIQYPTPDTGIHEEDILVVQGAISDVTHAAGYWNLAIMANTPIRDGDVITNEVGIAEVILRPRSSLNGKTLPDVRFGSTYNLTVLNIRRPGVDESLGLKETPLKFGDMLLVQGRWKDIFALKRLRHDFIVMGEPEAAEAGAFMRKSHAPIALVILIGMVLAMAFNLASLTVVSLVAAVATVLTGCITMDEAYESIDWKSLIVIAGLMPMSTALTKVGLVDILAQTLVNGLGGSGPVVVMGGVFILTVILTQLISNTATALLIAPVALATAATLNVNPQAFLMAVALGASMAFILPVSTPVTMMVMSAGNYRFGDFARVGAPIIGITFIIMLLVLPVLWPF